MFIPIFNLLVYKKLMTLENLSSFKWLHKEMKGQLRQMKVFADIFSAEEITVRFNGKEGS